jgi:uncharacterized protein YaaW (UPF0174 family)
MTAKEGLQLDELRDVLELATQDELEALTDILFRRKFNPLDYMYTPEPLDVQSQDWDEWLDSLEDRFRFLAADGITVLRRKSTQLSYRQILLQVCRYLKITYSQRLSTEDLEAEIFLFLLNRAWQRLPEKEQKLLTGQVQQAITTAQLTQDLPPHWHNDPVGLVLKGGSAIALQSILRPFVLQALARHLAVQTATYEVAKQAVGHGSRAIATRVQAQMAQRGMVISAARYGAARSVFSVLGPAMWAWFVADLGWRSISTNYSRIIPVIFTLAQIRLTRAVCYEVA